MKKSQGCYGTGSHRLLISTRADAGKEMWPVVQIYFGEDIEHRGGMEVLLLVDLDAGEVVEAFPKPLKPLPSRL